MPGVPLIDAVELAPSKLVGGVPPAWRDRRDAPVLVVLAAGRGTRFGSVPKCAQPVCGVPLARHSIDAFRTTVSERVVCVVGHRAEDVMAALGPAALYVRSDNPVGGTAFAAFEAFAVPGLADDNPLLVLTMGDRVVTAGLLTRLLELHSAGDRAADLTFLSAIYEPPRNRGKGRVVRDRQGRAMGIVEQRDIEAFPDSARRRRLMAATEGNCPLYVIRAATLYGCLAGLTDDNAQQQFYLTDIVSAIGGAGGDIRTVTVTPDEPDYALLCSDVTRPADLGRLEGCLAARSSGAVECIEDAARMLCADRPPGQVAAIAEQLAELHELGAREAGLDPGRPIGIGIAGGRVRIAFMHPDMGRFYGPAWQMPCGAGDHAGREQIVVIAQPADDGLIRFLPTDAAFREERDFVEANDESMYPGPEIADRYAYEQFGTRMAEGLLASLGYVPDAEISAATATDTPPPGRWVRNNMRRPFSLLANALASLRTLREGGSGERVNTYLGRDGFRGLRVLSSGAIPQGGFASSSAVTISVENALDALFRLGVAPDLLIDLACQAEYGTGVRAGALDQATEQKGRAGEGTLISSNPRENYRILGTYPVPAERFKVLFAYSVDRDRDAWRWSAGCYAAQPEPGHLTAAEIRKMTGKAAELAALITRLPLDLDFFQRLEPELLQHGELSPETRRWVAGQLLQLPLHATRDELRQLTSGSRPWFVAQLAAAARPDEAAAGKRADSILASLFDGWRDPALRRGLPSGKVLTERGAPLRAMVGYLFCEVAKNFRLIHRPEEWISCIAGSQRGDRCFQIDPESLPPGNQLTGQCAWEKGVNGPALLERWLARCGATPFDFNQGLDDNALGARDLPPLRTFPGTCFFRGLPLIDLIEAMLNRAFGPGAVAVRVNAAGQGDYFQIHVDTTLTRVEDAKQFVRAAFYRRFDLRAPREFVELSPGGGAAGVRLTRADQLPALVRRLDRWGT